MGKRATSNIYDTLYGGKHMRGGALASSQYAATSASASMFELVVNKKVFLTKVFATLLTQLSISYYIMTRVHNNESVKHDTDDNRSQTKPLQDIVNFTHKPIGYLTLFMVSLGLIIAMALIPMSMVFKFSLFSLFSGVIGLLLSVSMRYVDPAFIEMGVVGAMGVFATFFLLGLFLLASGVVLGNMSGLVLLGALLLLIITRIVYFFTDAYSQSVRVFAIVTLSLFSAYIVYDTNRLLQKDYYGDYITGALEYYLDILNVFVSLVRYQQR